MRFSELISKFTIAVTNEECNLLDRVTNMSPISAYTERDQFVIENLIRKSLLSKVNKNGTVLIIKNEYKT